MKERINLFPKKEQSLFDKIIFFSFHYLRYILVTTQLVVIMVFMFRFTVDQSIIDLKERIKQKQDIIAVSKPIIQQAEDLENRITNINKILSNQNSFKEMSGYFLSIFPDKVSTTVMTFSSDGLEFSGVSQDSAIIQKFYLRLQKDKRFKTVLMKDLKKVNNGFSFSISLKNFIPSPV